MGGCKKKQIVKKNSNGKKTTQKIRTSNDNQCIIWVFTKIDNDGPFKFSAKRDDFNSELILDKIINYSNMTWQQILRQTHDNGKSKNHNLDYKGLSAKAKDRIKAKRLDDYTECLYSIALNNLIRVVGIREEEKFYVLWYDPKHEVYPSHKR